jgi:FtsZ-binding cell division protein ZapB
MSTKKKEEQLALAGTEEGEILARLSERVERAVATITELRRERDAIQKRLDEAEGQLREQTSASERLSNLEEEHDRFQRERSEIRNRIESILSNLETLDAE